MERLKADDGVPPSSSDRPTQRIIVHKYGGSSVATTDKLKRVADLVVERRNQGFNLVVVVSAMGDATDELLAMARNMTPAPDRRELDMLLTVGERISMALLAMAIRNRGHEAVSLTGSQCGIITTASHTNARIMEVRPFRIQDELDAGRVVIVAGYQGVSYKREITTLGRGGSDTTAVALAAALNAEACEIYSDVDGVYTADPRIVPEAVPLASLSYDEMQTMAASGAKVLNHQAVEFAKRKDIALYARKTGSDHPGTVIRKNGPSTPNGVRGIAHQNEVLRIQAVTTQDRVQAFLRGLQTQNLSADHVRFDGPNDGPFSCLLPTDDAQPQQVRTLVAQTLGADAYQDGSGTISLVGDAMGAHVLPDALEQLSQHGIGVQGIASGTFRLTLTVPRNRVTDAAQILHAALGLSSTQA
ncbi:MAG: aspartate kinase [Myxococcota bacterium]